MMFEENALENIEKSLRILNVQILNKLEFPQTEKRTLDRIAKRDNDIVFMKIIKNVCTKNYIFKELKKLTEFLKINALVIAERINNDEVEEGVLHIKDKIGIVKPKTIFDSAKGCKIYIYEFKGMYYVKIDGKKLRELRIKKRYGLGGLAKTVGISVKALRDYEDGLIDMSIEKAYRFVEIFGKEFELALKEVDIFKDRITSSTTTRPREVNLSEMRTSSREKIILVRKFIEHGINAECFEYMPSDIILDVGKKKVFISIITSDVNSEIALSKSYYNKSISQTLNGTAATIVGDDISKDVIKNVESWSIVYKYSEFVKNIQNFSKEIEGEKTL